MSKLTRQEVDYFLYSRHFSSSLLTGFCSKDIFLWMSSQNIYLKQHPSSFHITFLAHCFKMQVLFLFRFSEANRSGADCLLSRVLTSSLERDGFLRGRKPEKWIIIFFFNYTLDKLLIQKTSCLGFKIQSNGMEISEVLIKSH